MINDTQIVYIRELDEAGPYKVHEWLIPCRKGQEGEYIECFSLHLIDWGNGSVTLRDKREWSPRSYDLKKEAGLVKTEKPPNEVEYWMRVYVSVFLESTRR
jgi:hypothetical protein